MDQILDFETSLAAERPRLVRLCTWFTRNEEVAQDLAQETLIAAWKNRDQLISVEKLKPWTSAIARNICLDWSRRSMYEDSHRVLPINSSEISLDDDIADETNLELELDRNELAGLLDKALTLLPPETAQVLIEHYIQESSHAEIAEKMNLNAGAVAVRIQRGKLTLQKLFQKKLQAESIAFGLAKSDSDAWEETNIWCIWCGQAHLMGKYRRNDVFALRCPICDPEPEMIMAALDLTKPYHTRLLGDTKTYKPAYSRLLTGLAPIYREALHSRAGTCLACGQVLDVWIDHLPKSHNHRNPMEQIHLHCPVCGWASNKAVSGLVVSLPQVQQFWRKYPRLRMLPAQHIEVDGSPAFVQRLQSVQDGAQMTVISRPGSFDPIAIHTNVSS